MTTQPNTQDLVTDAMERLATDYDMTAEFTVEGSEDGSTQYVITSPDSLASEVHLALEEVLNAWQVPDFSIANVSDRVSLIIH